MSMTSPFLNVVGLIVPASRPCSVGELAVAQCDRLAVDPPSRLLVDWLKDRPSVVNLGVEELRPDRLGECAAVALVGP